MQRIAVIGTSCSGKSTLAAKLSAALGIPHTQLDELYWGPNWTPVADDLFRERVAQAVGQPHWIIDGNYTMVRHTVWTAADTLVWLNYPFPTVFGRALRRTVSRAWTRKPLYAGNTESWLRSFCHPDSILLWVIQTHWSRRRRYARLLQEPRFQHLNVIQLQRPRDADRLVREVANGNQSSTIFRDSS